MRYSKLLFVLMLTLILVFGSSMSAFADDRMPEFSPPALHVLVEPAGSGSASNSTPYFDIRDWVWKTTLTATESNVDYYFVKWEVWKVMTQSWKFLSSDLVTPFEFGWETTVRAVFAEKPDLTIGVYDSDMGAYSGDPEGKYSPGDEIEIIPEPMGGYRLDYWTKNGDEYPPWKDISFEMPDNDVDIMLYFEEIPWFNITTDVELFEEWGTVTGEGSYQIGDEVTLIATPERGYAFDHWEWYWDCLRDDETSILKCPNPEPEIDMYANEITFEMYRCNGHFTAYFRELDGPFGVKLEAIRVGEGPDIVGNPTLGGNPLPGNDEFDGFFYDTEEFTVNPNPIAHWHFVGYDWEKIINDEEETPKVSTMNGYVSPYDSEDPDRIFTMHSWNKLIKVYYEEDDYVMATIEYHNTVGGELRPDDTVKVYLDEPYSFSPPAISGYQHIYSTPNASGTLTKGATDFVVTFVYQVPPTPQVITNTVTETVVVTQTVTVPATTAPTTEAVIPEEETPLGAAMIGFNFDEILEPVPVVEETPEELLPVEETPLGDALPQTGQLPADLFYGIGGLVSAMGVYLKRRK